MATNLMKKKMRMMSLMVEAKGNEIICGDFIDQSCLLAM